MGKRNRSRERHRRNDENPNVPLSLDDPDDDTFAALGAERTASGSRVNRKRSLGYPAIWRAVSLISGDVAKLPLGVYRKSGRNRNLDPKHPAYKLLMRKPNDAMTAFVFKQTIMAHVLTEGNGYAYVERDGAGRPIGLLLLNPDKVSVTRMAGALWYVYGARGGSLADVDKLPAADVLHIKGLGFDGLVGYPVLQYARESIGTALAARDYSARYFQNDARPGGALKHPGKLTPTARTNMRESWERLHTGLRNRHKVAILEEGVDFIPFESNARNAQLLENREFDSREIANIFGVPTHKLGDPSKVAYNSLEQENQSYYDDTLSRWLRGTAEECHDKLLSEDEKDSESHLIDFDYQEIQRADVGKQVSFVTSLVEKGVIDIDEGRAILGMNSKASPDPIGDPAPLREAIPAAGLRAVLTDTARRMVRRLTQHAKAESKGNDWASWQDRAAKSHGEIVREAFAPVVSLCAELGLSPASASSLSTRLIGDVSRSLAGLSTDQVAIIASEIERAAPEQIADSILGSKA